MVGSNSNSRTFGVGSGWVWLILGLGLSNLKPEIPRFSGSGRVSEIFRVFAHFNYYLQGGKCSLYKIAIPCSSDSYEEINLMCTRKELSGPFQNRLVSRIPLMVMIKNPLNKTNWVLFHLTVNR